MFSRSFAITIFGLFVVNTYAQITVSTGQTPTWLVENVLLSGGVQVSNVTYTGSPNAIGYFQTGVNPTNLGVSEGIILSTGSVTGPPSIGSPASAIANTSNGVGGDPLLTAIAGMQTYDAAILEFDFVPLSDTIEFRYVFASEEYHQYVNSFNDVFAFFINGPNPSGGLYENHNIALLPGTSIPVSINTVNNGNNLSPWNPCSNNTCTNCEFFIDNCNGTSIIFNGFTVVLTARAVVVPCETYHLKIAIADAVDRAFDSAVFLEAKSFSTNALSIDIEHTIGGDNNYAVQGCSEAIIHFSIPEPIPNDFVLNYEIAGSAINGVDYAEIPENVVIQAGETSTTLVIDPIYHEGMQGTKEVKLIYSNLCSVADTIVVEIIDYIPPTATGHGEVALCLYDAFDVQIGVSVSDGHEPYTYLWDNDAGDVPSPIVSPTSTTTYSVTITDVCGFEAAASVTVTVFPDPIISIVADPPEICSGSSSILTAQGAISYLWTGNGVSESTNPLSVSPDETTIYTVIGTDANNCSSEATITIPVYSQPQVTLGALDPVCANSAAFELTGGNPVGGVFSGQGVDGNGWFDPTESGTGAIEISYAFTDQNGCSDTATAFITVFATPQVTLDTFYPVCGNSDAFELSGGTPIGGDYSGQGVDLNGWFDPQETGPGTFEITYEYTDSNGCTNTTSSTIEVYSTPEASISGSSSICQNGSSPDVTFSATNGTAPYNFSYNIDDGPTQTVSTTNDNSEVSIPFNTSQIGTFNINLLGIEDANGCVSAASGTATIEVNEVDINISLVTSNVTCFGFDDGRVTITATGSAGQFEYSIDSTNFVSSPVFDNLAPGNYTLTVRDEFLCVTKANTTIEQPELMEIINIQIEDVYCRDIAAGGSILIEVMGGIEPYSFIWNDQNNSPFNNVTNFADSIIQGTYSVLISDSNGCTLEEFFTIGFLDEDCIVRFPQGFSPNADGINDNWEIRNLLYVHPNNRVKIFNRHGTLVFDAVNYDDDWDGRPNRGNVLVGDDGKVPPGVYFYLIWLEPDDKPINGYVYVSY